MTQTGVSVQGAAGCSPGGMRKKRNVVPAILDVVEVRASVALAVSDYYDGLSEEEAAEASKWGDFALRQFPQETE